MKVVLIAVGVFPPILLNTIDGVRSIDPLYLDTASVLRISRLRRLTHVILPAAAPKIFAGLRISLSIAVILMVISELIAATNGVGFRILQAQRQFKMVDLWAGLVVLGAIGAMLNAGLALIERRVLRWRADDDRRPRPTPSTTGRSASLPGRRRSRPRVRRGDTRRSTERSAASRSRVDQGEFVSSSARRAAARPRCCAVCPA